MLKFVVNNDPDLNGQNYLFLAIKARDQVIELFLVIKSVMLVFISTEMFFLFSTSSRIQLRLQIYETFNDRKLYKLSH